MERLQLEIYPKFTTFITTQDEFGVEFLSILIKGLFLVVLDPVSSFLPFYRLEE